MGIISVDDSKCVGCNSCVRVCPSMDANIAHVSSDGRIVIRVDEDKCIRCGACVKACNHGARSYSDDTEEFFKALDRHEEVALIVAPAIKIAFKENWQSLLTWFRKNGVSLIYDVSLGADICTWAHVRYLQQNSSANVITQPCAAIVNYVLKYRHQLIGNLSPVNSPMMCTAIYMRRYMGFNGKIAAISPCIAKKDEFSQTGHVINYNVTLGKLAEYLDNKRIMYKGYGSGSEFVFDGGKSYLGAIYSNPGGLKENLMLHVPNVSCVNSEGVTRIYKELDEYEKVSGMFRPQVFDVLNCEFGCNDGPGLGLNADMFKIRTTVFETGKNALDSRAYNLSKKGEDKQFADFDERLSINDFLRTYSAENVNTKSVKDSDIRKAFQILRKTTQTEMHFDCRACGYDSCQEMALAIAKGNNIPENCKQYNILTVQDEKKRLESITYSLADVNSEIEQVIGTLANNINVVDEQIGKITEGGRISTENMSSVVEYMSNLDEMAGSILTMMKTIDENIENYSKMTNSVRAIAGKINLLSLNASIESARAGEAGRAFAVVATNIRALSDSSKQSVANAEGNEESIRTSIDNVNQTVSEFTGSFDKLISLIEKAKVSVGSVSDNGKTIASSMAGLSSLAEKLSNIVKTTSDILKN